MKVSDLAEELGIQSKDITRFALKSKWGKLSPLHELEEEHEQQVREKFQPERKATKKESDESTTDEPDAVKSKKTESAATKKTEEKKSPIALKEEPKTSKKKTAKKTEEVSKEELEKEKSASPIKLKKSESEEKKPAKKSTTSKKPASAISLKEDETKENKSKEKKEETKKTKSKEKSPIEIEPEAIPAPEKEEILVPGITEKKEKPSKQSSGRDEIKVIARRSQVEDVIDSVNSKRDQRRLAGEDVPDSELERKFPKKIKYTFKDDRDLRKGRKHRFNDEEYSVRDRKKKKDKPKHTFNPRKKDIVISDRVLVSDLAGMTGIKAGEIIKSLMNLGIMTTINSYIDGETAQIALADFSVDVVIEKKKQMEDVIIETEEENYADEAFETRPPVLTVMGHVDHGKTSLLDKIRSSDIAAGEAGGITQHIAAYRVKTKQGLITFLDTPGHEAFTAMRARGANATDIVILVVAADDGPMPQTIEAINHAKASEVPIIVALNKCDKPESNPEKTMQMLMEHGLVAEEYGGDCTMIKVSAHTGKGVEELLEMASLQAETMELKANIQRPSEGVVIESELSRGQGNIVTVLVGEGILKHGDFLVIGTEYGRIRSMSDDHGNSIKEAHPGTPVALLGLNGLPGAGEKYHVVEDEKTARLISEERKQKVREKEIAGRQQTTMENMFDNIGEEESLTLNVIIKADVIGSAEAIAESLERQGNESVSVKVLHNSVGAISLSDVTLASASKAVIFGFNVRPDANAKKVAREEGVEIRLYNVIYDVIEDVRKSLQGMLAPSFRENILGKAEILEVFTIPKIGVIAGCKIIEGKVRQDLRVRVLRDNIVIHEGKISSLRRFKDNVKEVTEGFECGLGIESYKSFVAGDTLEFIEKIEEEIVLESK